MGKFFTTRWTNGITRRLHDLRRKSVDLSPVFQSFGLRMIRSIETNFRLGGRRGGAPGQWPKLRPSSIARRRKGQRLRPKVLVQSGLLKNSTSFSAGRSEFAVGTLVKYAPKHHQHGNWGGAMRIRQVAQIKAHTRTVWVSKDFDPKTSKLAKALRRAKSIESLREEGRGSAGRLLGERRKRTKRSRASGQKRRAVIAAAKGSGLRAKAHKPSRKGRKKHKVRVKAHTQLQDYVLRARPIYLFQPDDLSWLSRKLAKHFDMSTRGKG